jgi:hypothetical protein
MKLADLVGEHDFPIVPKTDIRHPLCADAGGVIFMLDDTVYLIFEDQGDGYRSHASPILHYQGSAYELGYDGYDFPTYLRGETVVCSHRTRGEYDHEDDVLEVRSKATGKLIFEVGTECIDDYYPGYVCRWDPTGLSANAAKEIADG